jgi:hypothetical protein
MLPPSLTVSAKNFPPVFLLHCLASSMMSSANSVMFSALLLPCLPAGGGLSSPSAPLQWKAQPAYYSRCCCSTTAYLHAVCRIFSCPPASQGSLSPFSEWPQTRPCTADLLLPPLLPPSLLVYSTHTRFNLPCLSSSPGFQPSLAHPCLRAGA